MSELGLILVEDDETLRKVLSRELAGAGFEVEAFASAEGVAEAVRRSEPDVALVDLRLPGRSGLDLLRELRELHPDLQVVMLTGHGGVPEAVEAMRAGAYDFLTKPTRLDVLEQVLRRAAEKGRLVLENRRLRRAAGSHADPQHLVGDGESMQRVRALVARIGPSEAPVLILGESGTGKELVARNLHRESPRREQPWVVLNCGAVAAELVESELFGHERGAFTGADRKAVGLFEAAHGGTLFLDEVGELPPAIQPALLRVLQFGEIRPVGSTRTRSVDVRVLSATNRDLARDVEEGRFREDLFYRLSTFQIRVPPLRERLEDVPALARAFLAEASARAGRRLELDDGALAALKAHPWPGNIRELQNAVTRLSVLAPGERITADDVRALAFGAAPSAKGGLPTLRVEELERMAVLAALDRTSGEKAAAADMLGISLRTLYNKLKAYGIT